MAAWIKWVCFVGVLALAVAVTGPKFLHLAQIRGWISGAKVESVAVTQKWLETHPQQADAAKKFWVSWTEQDVRQPGNHRVELPRTVWERLEIGSSLDLVHLSNDAVPYARQGLVATDEAIGLQAVFLVAEISFLLAMAWLFASTWRKQRDLPPRPDWCQLPPE